MMPRSRLRRLLIAALAVTLGLPAATALGYVLTGQTVQRRGITLQFDPTGGVRQIRLSFRAPCRRARSDFTERTVLTLRRPASRSFAVSAASPGHQGEFTYRTVLTVRGQRRDSRHWRGRIDFDAVVRRHGRPYDRCRLDGDRWAVSAPGGTLSMTSAPGDSIGVGGRYRYVAPADAFLAYAQNSREAVVVQAGGWTLSFAADHHRRLHAGHFAGATRYPFNGSAPGLDVFGHGRGCNESFSDFTVRSVRFARDGTVTDFSATFIQHCENPQAPPLVGDVTYER